MHHRITDTGNKRLQLQANWDPAEVRAYIERHDIAEIFYYENYEESASMEAVLAPYSDMRRLFIYSHRAHDWAFLQAFTHLEQLLLSVPGNASINLSCSSQLHWLHCPWHPQIALSALTKLQTLNLIEYTPINLEPLAALTGLHFLGLLEASVQSLKGISALTSLQNLHLWNCRNLKWIAALNGLPQLQLLLIQGSRRVKDYAQLTDLPALERITLDHCGDIPAITFLRKLNSLKYVRLGGNTRVMDKNTRPLEGIPAAFYNRRDLRSIWGPR